jgi:hypothetical protein
MDMEFTNKAVLPLECRSRSTAHDKKKERLGHGLPTLSDLLQSKQVNNTKTTLTSHLHRAMPVKK